MCNSWPRSGFTRRVGWVETTCRGDWLILFPFLHRLKAATTSFPVMFKLHCNMQRRRRGEEEEEEEEGTRHVLLPAGFFRVLSTFKLCTN